MTNKKKLANATAALALTATLVLPPLVLAQECPTGGQSTPTTNTIQDNVSTEPTKEKKHCFIRRFFGNAAILTGVVAGLGVLGAGTIVLSPVLVPVMFVNDIKN